MPEEKKYAAVVRYALGRMDGKEWKPGAKLPSVRRMAEEMGCSINTVLRAYEFLQGEGYLYSKPKSGYYVAAAPQEKPRPVPDIVPFDAASPDERAMPYEAFFHYMSKAVFQRRGALFDYGDPQGTPSLRRALAKHLRDAGLLLDERRIFVVSGAQQALQLLAAMPFPNGKTRVLVEQPAYHGMLGLLRLQGVPAIPLARTAEGVDLERLERHFREDSIKFFYTCGRFHNPTGWSYPKAQREAIARLARKYDVYIVEDDYLADLEPRPKGEPIAARDGCEKVVYVKSFSKTMLPGMRLGLAALPAALVEPFRAFKRTADLGTSTLSQTALEQYLDSGLFDAHRKSVAETYRARLRELSRACRETLPPQLALEEATGGIFAALRLPPTLPEAEFVRAMREAGAPVMAGERFYLPGVSFAVPMVRLGVIRTDDAAIRRGVEALSAAASRLLRTTPKERNASPVESGSQPSGAHVRRPSHPY